MEYRLYMFIGFLFLLCLALSYLLTVSPFFPSPHLLLLSQLNCDCWQAWPEEFESKLLDVRAPLCFFTFCFWCFFPHSGSFSFLQMPLPSAALNLDVNQFSVSMLLLFYLGFSILLIASLNLSLYLLSRCSACLQRVTCALLDVPVYDKVSSYYIYTININCYILLHIYIYIYM